MIMTTKKSSSECCSPDRSESSKQWTLVALGAVSLAFSLASITTCNFISLEGEAFPTSKGFGIFKQDVEGQCENYSERTNGGHAMAKAFGLLSVLAIAGALLCVVIAIHILKDSKLTIFAWHSGRALFASALYSVLFTFFFYASPIKRSLCTVEGAGCKAGPGAIITALNSVLLVALSILAMLTLAPKKLSSKEETTDKKQADQQVEKSGSWFSAKESQDKAVTTTANSTNPQKRNWFGSKSTKVVAGAAVAGGAVATVAATRSVANRNDDEESQAQRSLFGRKKTQTKTVTIEPVEDEEAATTTSWFGQAAPKEVEQSEPEKKRGWFGSKSTKVVAGSAVAGGAAATVTATCAASEDHDEENQSQRSLFGRKKTPQAKSASAEAAESKEVASSSWFGTKAQEPPEADVTQADKKRSWFGSRAKAASGGAAAATATSQSMEDKSERSLFGPKPKEPTDEDIERAEKKKRTLLGSIFRSKTKGQSGENKEEISPNADTRRALFGSDVDSATTEPKSVMLAKPEKSKAQSPDEVAVVSNETVSSSCPPCYCLP